MHLLCSCCDPTANKSFENWCISNGLRQVYHDIDLNWLTKSFSWRASHTSMHNDTYHQHNINHQSSSLLISQPSMIMSKKQKKEEEIPWSESDAKMILEQDLASGVIPLDSKEMEPRIVYQQ